MPHRGRLNVLANIAGKSYGQIFKEFEGSVDPKSVQGSGDVKYHLGTEGTFTDEDGETTQVYLAANPSHLEAVDPVLEGIVRAKQDRLDLAGEAFTVLPLLMHGDAAFAGQGVVAETLNLSQLRGYRTGGTIHLVVNNQVGFTTSPSSSRSSFYSTDVARMVQAPIFHVNGDDPEACVRVAELAFDFRQEFNKDVVIDLVCYRRRGHNEGDDPSMTQPLMYNLIEAKRSVRKLYTEALTGRGDISVEESEAALKDYQAQLERAFTETQAAAKAPVEAPDRRRDHRQAAAWSGRPPRSATCPSRPARCTTAVPVEMLHRIGDAFVSPPEGFTVHPKIQQLLDRRKAMTRDGGIDWAMGELLAFGSLLLEQVPVRLAGQDSRRGTFVQRHAVLIDKETAEEWTPLLYLSDDQARFWVYDSLLSRVRGDGLRVRLLGRAAGRAGAVGGAVRRLRQRRAEHRRRVHLQLGAEVGPALLGRAAAAARLRGPGPGPLVGPDRALPADVRRGQHDGGDAEHARVVLPPAAPPGLRPSAPAADRLHAEVDAAAQGGRQRGRGPDHRDVRAGPRRPARSPTRRRSTACCCARARSTTTWSPRGRRSATPTPRSSGSSSSRRCRTRRSSPRSAQFPDAELVWAQEEPANQGPWPYVALNLPEYLGGRAAARGLPADVGLDRDRLVEDARARAADPDRAGLRPLSLAGGPSEPGGRAGWPAMYFTDRGIEELARPARRGAGHARVAGRPAARRSSTCYPEFETPVERLATWLARDDDDDDEPDAG